MKCCDKTSRVGYVVFFFSINLPIPKLSFIYIVVNVDFSNSYSFYLSCLLTLVSLTNGFNYVYSTHNFFTGSTIYIS